MFEENSNVGKSCHKKVMLIEKKTKKFEQTPILWLKCPNSPKFWKIIFSYDCDMYLRNSLGLFSVTSRLYLLKLESLQLISVTISLNVRYGKLFYFQMEIHKTIQ